MPLFRPVPESWEFDSDAREPLSRSEAVQAAARRPHQKVPGWRLASRRRAGPTPSISFTKIAKTGASQEVGERDPGEIPPGRHFRQSALMNSRSSAIAAKSDRA